MKEGKHVKKNFKIVEAYSVLILIATILMSIVYAEISGINLNISGEVEAIAQRGVFITNITNTANNNADTENSKINYYIGTMFDSEIVLGSTSSSSISYQVTLYNNSNINYVFIGVLTDYANDILYSNENIDYSIDGLVEYDTTIAPTESLKFTITFKYKDGENITDKTLKSKLNFRFKEIPILVLSNEGETYTLNDIYPNYTSETYEFTVSNYNKSRTNTVPMKYSFETTISAPLTAKIYDEDNNEITENMNIEGDGQTQIEHTYTLKIVWDESNPTAGIDYNSLEYENTEFECSVKLKAIPEDTDYIDYTIEKQFDVKIRTASLYFNPSTDATNIVIKDGVASLPMTINNYNSDTKYNKFDAKYEVILIEGTDKFTISLEDTNNGTIKGGKAIENSFNIKFSADMDEIDLTESVTLKIVLKSPYPKEITLSPISINFHEVTVTLDANGGTVSPSKITVYRKQNL